MYYTAQIGPYNTVHDAIPYCTIYVRYC